MFLIYALILFFVLILGYQFMLVYSKKPIVEGLENETEATYQPYNMNDPNNALILSQQNAGNIEVLKGRVDALDGVKESVNDMQQNINSMQTQIDGLVQQQVQYAQDIAGTEPPVVTGTEGETAGDVEVQVLEDE